MSAYYTDIQTGRHDRLDSPASLIASENELRFCGDPGAALAALSLAMGREVERAAQHRDNRAQLQEQGEQDAQLSSMRARAAAGLVSGIVGGALAAASGVASGVATIRSAQADAAEAAASAAKADASTAAARAAKPDASTAAASAAKAPPPDVEKLRRSAAYARIASDSINAGSKLTTSGLDFVGAAHDADATRHAQSAARATGHGETARTAAAGAAKLMDRALEFAREYQAAKAETLAVAARRA
jgi:hypothetical protein